MSPDRAHQLFKDEEFQGLIAQLRAEFLDDFSRTPVTATDQMVRIRMQLQCLDAMVTRLESLATDYERKTNDQPKRSHA